MDKDNSIYSVPNVNDNYVLTKEVYLDTYGCTDRKDPFSPEDFKLKPALFPDLD